MDKHEALALLELDSAASERQIRSQLFRKYQSVTTALSELDDERQRPLIESQLDRLNQAREVLLTQAEPQTSSPTLGMINTEDLPEDVNILLYRRGGQEGIHTLQVQGQDIVLGFESSFGARKYAQRLAQNGLPKPVTERFPTAEIVEFCQSSGYGFMVIPSNETIDPPEATTEAVDDWRSP